MTDDVLNCDTAKKILSKIDLTFVKMIFTKKVTIYATIWLTVFTIPKIIPWKRVAKFSVPVMAELL